MNKKHLLLRVASYLSVSIGLVITIMKIYASIVTDSLSILSSTIDSVFDVVASFLNLYALRYALKPADEDHRFGHGKAEDLSSLVQSIFIAATPIFILVEAVKHFIHPVPIFEPFIGMVVIVISSILALILILFQYYVIKETRSIITESDHLHYKADLLVNLSVILVMFLSIKYSSYARILDLIIAVGISLYILERSFFLCRKAIDNLMDKEFLNDERNKVIDIALENKNVLGLHDLRTRRSGMQTFIQLHIELDESITVKQAHKIAENVENSILEHFPDSEIIIHQDIYDHRQMPLQLGQVLSIKSQKNTN